MGADEWPAAARPNPFIPVSLQRAARMPHADAARELEYARQLLQHLCQSSGELIASFARLEDETPAAASSLLSDASWRPLFSQRAWPANWLSGNAHAGLETVEHLAAPPVRDDEVRRVTGGSAILANQASCPFRAFAKHRLGARPLADPEVALTAADRGSMLHDAMNHLWGELESSDRLAMTPPGTCLRICKESAGIAVQAFRKQHGAQVPVAMLVLEEQRLGALLNEWLDVERRREDFVVLAREQCHEFVLGPLSISLRIDRVDELADGRKLIIDYKTGDSKVKLWLGERPEDPQLPLYSLMLAEGDVAGIGFAVLRHSALEYRGLADGKPGPGFSADIARATKDTPPRLEGWAELQAHWQRILTALGEEFLNGRSFVDPIDRKRSCLYCGLEALCRIR
jgi:probable DNA repair protein